MGAISCRKQREASLIPKYIMYEVLLLLGVKNDDGMLQRLSWNKKTGTQEVCPRD